MLYIFQTLQPDFSTIYFAFWMFGINRGKQSIIKKHTSTMTLNLKHTHFRNYSKKDQQNLGRSLERRFQPEGSFKAPASKEGSKVVKINIFCSISYIRIPQCLRCFYQLKLCTFGRVTFKTLRWTNYQLLKVSTDPMVAFNAQFPKLNLPL